MTQGSALSADLAGAPVAEAAVGSFGRLVAHVNAAGIVAFGSAEHDDDTMEKLFASNAMAPLCLVRGAVDAATTATLSAADAGLASRPILGTAPTLPEGFAPAAVTARIVRAIEAGATSFASSVFSDGS